MAANSRKTRAKNNKSLEIVAKKWSQNLRQIINKNARKIDSNRFNPQNSST